jgi:hypothetical protein
MDAIAPRTQRPGGYRVRRDTRQLDAGTVAGYEDRGGAAVILCAMELRLDDSDGNGHSRLLARSWSLGRRHPLFLRWVVLQAVVATLLAAAALAYFDQLQGASLAMVPVILAVLAGASGYAGLLAWRDRRRLSPIGGLRHLWFAAGVCQLLGLLGTVAGFYAMFNHGGAAAATATLRRTSRRESRTVPASRSRPPSSGSSLRS